MIPEDRPASHDAVSANERLFIQFAHMQTGYPAIVPNLIALERVSLKAWLPFWVDLDSKDLLISKLRKPFSESVFVWIILHPAWKLDELTCHGFESILKHRPVVH